MEKMFPCKIFLLLSFLLLMINTISCNKEEKKEKERLINYEKNIIKEWGESPVTILNRELPREGNELPCPSGWDIDCEYLWKHNVQSARYEEYRKSYTDNEIWSADLISSVNQRISRPIACNSSSAPNIERWPRQTIQDPIASFSNYMRRYGSTNGGMVMIAIDPNVIEAALQIAVTRKNISESELEGLRKAAIAQLFKPRAKSFIIMHNGENPIYFGSWELKLVNMKNGAGNLVGMSISMGRGLQKLKAGLMIFEDRVCSNDVAFSVNMPLANGYAYDFIFEGEGNLLTLLAAAFQSNVPDEPVLNFVPQKGKSDSYDSGRVTSQMSSGISTLRDIWGIVQFALEIVKFIRGI